MVKIMQSTQLSTSMKDYISAIYVLTQEKDKEGKNNGLDDEQPIIRVKDIASKLGVAPPSVVEYVQRLKDSGIVNVFPRKGVSLTKDGIKEAIIISNRYKIMQCFFANILNVDNELAINQAHTIEHLIDPNIVKNLYNHIEATLGCPNDNCKLVEQCIPQ
jgi:DtxR family Mn-dependent transcriptional regulator